MRTGESRMRTLRRRRPSREGTRIGCPSPRAVAGQKIARGFRRATRKVMAAPPRGGELRLLCLHGYGQNAERFRARTGALRKALRGRARLLYLDAPHRLPAEEQPGPEGGGGGGPRGWWPEAAARPEPEAALRAVAAALAELGPVDGLLGFSQGAALAGLLCALRERGDGRFPFGFVLLVAGFPVAEAAGAAAGALRVPSLHVFGRDDRVIPAAESRALAERFARPALLAHDGGHFVPAAAAQRAAYLGFLRRFEGPAEDELGPPGPPPTPPRASDSRSAVSLRGSGEGLLNQAAAGGGGGRGGKPRTGDPQDTEPASPSSGL
ncbi:esterase OVCA2 [Ahaetulla prasina]|uniref:esterase OVCA2 n=1 Tax=Ahaetulla prasina TaxID=499056 RepID=UPI0026487850|nr:esterase OVCA2 [Ahaetulla prasina]